MKNFYLLIILSFFSVTVKAQWAGAVLDSLTNNNIRDEVSQQSIAVDDNNTVHVVYLRAKAAGGWVIYYKNKPHNMPWSNEVMVSDTNFAAFSPAIAVDKAAGIPYITYVQDPGMGMEIYLGYNNGSGWTSNAITANNDDDQAPSIAVDGNGKVHLAWIGLDSLGLYKIYYGNDISGTWDIQILTNSNLGQFGTGAEPFIATTTGGTAHIIYRGGGFSSYNIDHAYNDGPGGNNWLYENIITPNNEDYMGVMTIGPDSIVNVAITGSGGFGFPNDVYYLYQEPGQQWSFPEQINSNFNGEAYSIFLDTAGYVHISINETSGNFYMGNVFYASDLQGGGGWLVTPLLTTGDIFNASIILDNENYGYALAFRGVTFETQEVVVLQQPDTITAVNNISIEDNFQVYPNPAEDFLVIKVRKEINYSIDQLKIFDVNGKLIKVINEPVMGDNSSILKVSDLKSGIYYLQVDTEKGNHKFKFIRQ